MTTNVSSTSSSAPLIVNGLISGIDTTSVISALLESYEEPITNLQDQQGTLNSNASEYQAINADMQALLTASDALNTSSEWNLATATSSNSAVASASSSAGAQTGTLSFNVDQLAQGNMVVSQEGVASTGTVVTNAQTLLVATGAPALGFTGLAADGALSVGSHSIVVTQSSQAATVTGASALPTSTTIDSSNDTLALTVGTSSYTLSLADGAATPAQLVTAINEAATSAGAPVTASLSSSGSLQLSTTEQGSQAAISVDASSALSSLGLTANQSATGTDAIVTVDGTSTTLSAISEGASVNLAAPSGSITATIASSPASTGSLVSAGTAKAAVVSTGNGSLANVVAGIDNSGLSVTAEAVQESSGSYLLQVGANATGLAGAVTIDQSAFTSGPLGGINTITDAQDALVSVGGSGGYEVTSSSNTFNGLLSGTAITVASTGQATVTVAPDAAGEAANVQSLVSAANQALSDISQYAGYNETTKAGGPLMGSAILSSLQQEILSTFASVGGASGLGNATSAGVTVTSSGTITFNQATFEQAYAANPTQVASMFTQGGTFSAASPSYAGSVSLAYAGTNTEASSFPIVITQSATQATDTGSVLSSGTTGSAETLSVSDGSGSASYAVAANESLTAVAAGLNSAFASAGLGITAAVINSGTQLQLTSNDYGSNETFQVSSSSSGTGMTGLGGASAGTEASFSGQDVAGTINGVAATGSGQVLAAPTSDPTLQGLSLIVAAANITSATSIGSFSYTPGLAQQLASLADQASNATTGSITTTIQGLQSESTGLDGQITNYQKLESSQQTLLQNEFATMESTLGNLKNESSQLTSSLSGLS